MHRQRFPGEDRLVYGEFTADQLGIGRYDVTQPDAHDVTRDNPPGILGHPLAVAQHPSSDRQSLLQSLKGSVRSPGLYLSKHGVYRQQRKDYAGFDVVLEHVGKHDGQFQEPRHGSPVAQQEIERRVALLLDDLIKAEYPSPSHGLLPGKTPLRSLQKPKGLFDRNA